MATAQTTPRSDLQKALGWLKFMGKGWVIGLIIVGTLVFSTMALLPQSKTSGVGSIKNLSSLWKPARWDAVEVITCPMGLATWEAGSGWCYTKTEQKPGKYRLRLRTESDGAWQMRLASGDYKKVSLAGMWLSDGWTNTPFEEEFLAEAPVKNNRVGSIIGRVGINGQPFDAFADGGEFAIEEPDRVGVSINLPNKKKYFDGNGGKIVLRLERKAD